MNITLYAPNNINYIINYIINKKYITFSKVSADWWQVFFQTINENNIKINVKSITTDVFYDMLINTTDRIPHFKKNNITKQSYKISRLSFSIPINFICNAPDDFVIGISSLTPGKNKEFIKNKTYLKQNGLSIKILKTLEILINKKIEIFDAFMWKVWGYNDQLIRLCNACNKNKNKICIIAPNIQNQKAIANNINAIFVEIDPHAAIFYIDEYIEKIKKIHEPNMVYLIQGGSAGMALSYLLHNELKDKYIFDIGLALHYI